MTPNNHDQRRQRLCLRRCSTRQFGNRRHSRGAFSQSLRGVEPGAPGRSPLLRTIVPGRGAWDWKLRHDHGSNYMSRDFQDEIECLGIEASPSFVREPEGNRDTLRSSARSRRTCCGSGSSIRSRNYAKLSGSSRITITKTGWSLGMAIKRPTQVRALNFGLPMQMSESYPWAA